MDGLSDDFGLRSEKKVMIPPAARVTGLPVHQHYRTTPRSVTSRITPPSASILEDSAGNFLRRLSRARETKAAPCGFTYSSSTKKENGGNATTGESKCNVKQSGNDQRGKLATECSNRCKPKGASTGCTMVDRGNGPRIGPWCAARVLITPPYRGQPPYSLIGRVSQYTHRILDTG